MQGKLASMLLSLLLVSTIILAHNVQPVKSDYAWTQTIYIRADGSISPSTAPISSVDNVTYTLTDNIAGDVTASSSAITIQRDDIIIDGTGNTLQGTLASNSTGIELTGRSNITIKNMKITAFYYGIWLASSSDNSVSGNNITANSLAGIWLDSSNNNSVSGNNITANNGYGGIWLDSSNNNSVSGNNITNNGETLFETGEGIILDSSNNNSVSGNSIANNGAGMWLYSSSNNSISGNNIAANEGAGMWLYSSSNNSISGNNIANNGHGILLDSSNNNNVSGNNMTDNWLEGIILDSSNNNSVSGNNVAANSGAGMWLYSSSNNSISGNNIVANNWRGFDYGGGILLDSSSNNNSVSGNNITNSGECGIWLYRSSNNIIYHNNFIDNTNQVVSSISTNVWDHGYPSSGNYWSDYAGVDLYSGPYQNQTGSDGIGDTPYTIDSDNRDNYPLMELFSKARADINDDGTVDGSDLIIIARAFGSYGPNYLYPGSPQHPRWNPIADINSDGVVDGSDMILTTRMFGHH